MNQQTFFEGAIALASLTSLELVLGIDNIIFISILAGKVPVEEQMKARRCGLALALLTRILLLLSVSWIAGLTQPFLHWRSYSLSGRDCVLLGGGLFLLAKTAHEIHQMLEPPPAAKRADERPGLFWPVIFQIALLDLVFSLDSVITAVGMVENIRLMVAAMVLAMLGMVLLAEPLAGFVDRHPSVKMLALSFLMLIGTILVAEGLGHHFPKNYVYFAMVFSLVVEVLNIQARRVASR